MHVCCGESFACMKHKQVLATTKNYRDTRYYALLTVDMAEPQGSADHALSVDISS